MNFPLIREFKLSPAGSGRGTSCDSNGAYIGNVALLKRIDREDRTNAWQPRKSDELSSELSTIFGVPVDFSSKSGGGTRIDVLAQMAGVTVGIEVKTGERPSLTLSQLLVYPHMIYGESVISDNPRITTFGYERGQVPPPIPDVLMYVRSPSSKPDFDELDAKKMTEEYLRRLRLLGKSFEVRWLFRNMSGG